MGRELQIRALNIIDLLGGFYSKICLVYCVPTDGQLLEAFISDTRSDQGGGCVCVHVGVYGDNGSKTVLQQ